jgi:small-conductance mechanosensitive channel
MRCAFFLLLFLFQLTPSIATGSFSLYESSQLESTPKSTETKKIIKQLENPEERQKILKILKVLATAQEMEEKKQPQPLITYLNPVFGWMKDTAAALVDNSGKVQAALSKSIDYFKNKENRVDFWMALLWLPALLLIEILFERMHVWLLNRSFKLSLMIKTAKRVINSKADYASYKIFLPFLYPIMFIPLYIANPYVRDWVIGFWIILFAIRLFIFEKKTLPIFTNNLNKKSSPLQNMGVYMTVGFLASILGLGLGLIAVKVHNGQEFYLTPFLLMSVPLFIVYLRDWQTKGMVESLKESKNLTTTPQKLAPLINIVIRYIPLLILIFTIPLAVDWIFFKGNLWKNYGVENIATLLILSIFLKSRRYIESLIYLQIFSPRTANDQFLKGYLLSTKTSVIKGLQLIWYLLFFSLLLVIWNKYLLGFLVDILSYPLSKTILIILSIWAVACLIWISINRFVDFHTNPQNIKGKRREPTVFAKTFGPVLHSVARWVLIIFAIFLTLESLGFDLKILVYLMSAFALAISLGAQSLVKDVINGFFALIDGSFAVGDVVTIGAYTGAVESLSLRAITLRHGSGYLQTIPFSEVGSIINKSRHYNVVPIDVATSYKTEIGNIYEALTKAAEDIANDPVFGKMILEPLSVSGVDRFTDNAVHVSASIKILPDPSNNFAREFNRRLKIHMDALNIIPPISFYEPWERS